MNKLVFKPNELFMKMSKSTSREKRSAKHMILLCNNLINPLNIQYSIRSRYNDTYTTYTINTMTTDTGIHKNLGITGHHKSDTKPIEIAATDG